MWIYHILLIHSSIDGHLGFLYFLASRNSIAMNIHVYLFEILFSVLLSCIPRRGIAGSHGNSMFTFLRNHQTFPQWLNHFFTPTSKVQGSNFLISPPVLIFLFFIKIPLGRGRWGMTWHLTVIFDLHIPNGDWCWASFYVLIGQLYILFAEISIRVFCLNVIGLYIVCC